MSESPQAAPLPTAARRIVWALVAVLGVLALAGLYHRSCYVDDAWLGERAYWLAREGVARSDLFVGLVGYGERTFVFHKLFALTGAALVSLFGWSLYVLKTASLVAFLAFVEVLRRYCRRYEAPGVFPLTLLVLLAHGVLMRHAFIYRPEVMLMALGFGSFVLLRRHLESFGWRALLGAAALAGLGALAHLNGLMFIGAGVVLLLTQRRWWSAAVFAGASSAVALLYLSDALVAGEMATFLRQFGGDPQLAERVSGVGNRVASVLMEHQRYFHSREEILFTALVLAVVAFTARRTGLGSSLLLPYTLALALSLAVLCPEKQTYYALPLVPYLALMVARGLRSLPGLGRPVQVTLATALLLHLASGAFELGRIIATNEDTASRNRALATHIGPPGTTVLATLPFVFDEIERYRIRGLTYYWIRNRFGKYPRTPEELFADARGQGIAFVVMSREDLKFSGWGPDALKQEGPGFRRVHEDEDHLVLELF